MTTETQTAKMIYADANVARMILGKMKKSHPERQYTVMKVTTGWQVCGVTVCPTGMPAKKPLAWSGAIPAPEGKLYGNASAGDVCVELAFPYLKNSKRFWYFELNGERWLHKNNCVSAEVVDGQLKLKLPVKIAQKHGLVS